MSENDLADTLSSSYDRDMTKSLHKEYYRPSVTVDVVIFTIENDSLQALLIQRNNMPFKDFSALPGGFLQKDETSEEAARRILKDKAGIEKVYIEQLFTFDDINRDPRGPVISITYFAIAPKDQIKITESLKTETPRFIPITHLPKLAFDHKKIIEYAIERLQSKLEYTNIAYSLLPKEFTLTELQKIYEVGLGREMDKRNFRKKFIQLQLIKDTGKFSKGGRQRPARLFTFINRKISLLKKFF